MATHDQDAAGDVPPGWIRSCRASAADAMPKNGISIENGADGGGAVPLEQEAPARESRECRDQRDVEQGEDGLAVDRAQRGDAGRRAVHEQREQHERPGGDRADPDHERRVSGARPCGSRTFDRPQAAAAAMISAKAGRFAPHPGERPGRRRPARTARPASWTRRGRSRSNTTANSTVNSAWLCSTSELSPAGMPAAIPAKQQRELGDAEDQADRDDPAPTAPAGGRRTARPGNAARVNRRALNISGGKCRRPISITTKLTPQIAVTATTRAMSAVSSAQPSRPPSLSTSESCFTQDVASLHD